MNKLELVNLLKEDLKNEYGHMLFYLNASICIQGPFREELGEFLRKEADDEMNHVEQFGKLILDLDGIPDFDKLDYPKTNLTNVKDIIQYAFNMETEVVERYVQRMDDAISVGGVDGRYVEIFLEDQILDSRTTAAHLKQILKNL